MSAKQVLKVNAATIARMCNITRQSVYGAEKTGLLIKVDDYFSLENPVNIQYLEGHGGNIQKYLQTIAEEEAGKNRPEIKHRDPVYKDTEDPEKTKHDLDKILLQERARDFKIRNEMRLKNLVSKKIVARMMGEISQSISISLVDLPRRNAPQMAALFKRPELEREGELFLSKIIEKAIEAVIVKIEKIQNKDHF